VEQPHDPLVDAILAAPVGAALVAVLEGGEDRWQRRRDVPSHTDPTAVEHAAQIVERMSFGQFAALVLDVAQHSAGPWMPGSPDALARSYRHAAARRPIAQAITERFGATMRREFDRDAQEWWTTDPATNPTSARPLFTGFDHRYANGEFTHDGLWTVTGPLPEAHADLLMQWEMDWGSPASRWHLPVDPRARIYEIHRPGDWVRLVETYPSPPHGPFHPGWELPGPNQHLSEIATLLAVDGQHAARATVTGHMLPDWAAIARDYDGVHLSWAGFTTSEGFISDTATGAVTMLRYWASERTLWLADVFGDATALPAPDIHGNVPRLDELDDPGLRARLNRDLQYLRALLGR
jgi:hypothetical protein